MRILPILLLAASASAQTLPTTFQDPISGQPWLPLWDTYGMSCNQAATNFPGYQVATRDQVVSLFYDIGLTPSMEGTYCDGPDTYGPTHFFGGWSPWAVAAPEDTVFGSACPVLGWSNDSNYILHISWGDSTWYGADFAAGPGVSVWMIQSVPEPSVLGLVMVGLALGRARARAR